MSVTRERDLRKEFDIKSFGAYIINRFKLKQSVNAIFKEYEDEKEKIKNKNPLG